MTNIVWQNTQIPGFGGALNAANKSVSNFNSVVDNFKQGQLDKADRKIAAEDRAFKREGDLLNREYAAQQGQLTDQQIVQGLFEQGTRQSIFDSQMATEEQDRKSSVARAFASNAQGNLNNQKATQNKKLVDDMATLTTMQNSGEYDSIDKNGNKKTDFNRMLKDSGASQSAAAKYQEYRGIITGSTSAKKLKAEQDAIRKAAASAELLRRQEEAEGGFGEFDSTARTHRSQVQTELEELHPNNPEKVLSLMQRGEGVGIFGGRTFDADTVRAAAKKANKNTAKTTLTDAPNPLNKNNQLLY